MKNGENEKQEYSVEEHIITGRQKWWKKIIEWFFTILGWLIMASYLIYIIYGMFAVKYDWFLPEFTIYTRGMIEETRGYFKILFIGALIVVLFLIIWKNYNLLRFGRLHRRKFRPPVNNNELMELFEIDEETLRHMQSDRITVLEENIIPEDLGVNYKKEKKRKRRK